MAEERQKSSSIWTKTLKIFAIVSFVLLYVIYDASGKIYNTGVVEVWATGDELYSHETKQQATIKLDGNWHQLEINVVGNSLAVLRIYPVQNGEMAKFVEISDVRIGDYTVDLTTEQERMFWATIEQPIEMRAGNILRLPELTDDPWVEGHFKNNESTEKVLFKMRVVPEDITFFDWVMVGQFLSAHHAMSWDKLF